MAIQVDAIVSFMALDGFFRPSGFNVFQKRWRPRLYIRANELSDYETRLIWMKFKGLKSPACTVAQSSVDEDGFPMATSIFNTCYTSLHRNHWSMMTARSIILAGQAHLPSLVWIRSLGVAPRIRDMKYFVRLFFKFFLSSFLAFFLRTFTCWLGGYRPRCMTAAEAAMQMRCVFDCL